MKEGKGLLRSSSKHEGQQDVLRTQETCHRLYLVVELKKQMSLAKEPMSPKLDKKLGAESRDRWTVGCPQLMEVI